MITHLHVEAPSRKGETAKPQHTLELMTALGPTRAAKLLGTSTTTLYKAQRSGVVSKVIEVAAEAKMHELSGPEIGQQSGKKLFLASVDQDKSEIAEKMLRALGAEFLTD